MTCTYMSVFQIVTTISSEICTKKKNTSTVLLRRFRRKSTRTPRRGAPSRPTPSNRGVPPSTWDIFGGGVWSRWLPSHVLRRLPSRHALRWCPRHGLVLCNEKTHAGGGRRKCWHQAWDLATCGPHPLLSGPATQEKHACQRVLHHVQVSHKAFGFGRKFCAVKPGCR